MENDEQIRVLSGGGQPVILQLPTRHFPSVAVQGDTLSQLVMDLERAESMKKSDPKEASRLVSDVKKDLQGWLVLYESVLKEHGYRRPY